MPYITSIERLGRQEGRQEGRRKGMIAAKQDAVLEVLEVRFGQVPKALRKTVGSIRGETRLSALHKSAIQVGSLGDFIRLLEGSKSRES